MAVKPASGALRRIGYAARVSDWLVGVAVPIALWTLAFLLGRRELQSYRESNEVGSDLFRYSRGRLIRRMSGIAVLVATAATFAAMELMGPKTPRAAAIYLALLATEVAALVILGLGDLIETRRSADSSELRRQADPDRRTRSRPRRPR
jgi:hypothetical protein